VLKSVRRQAAIAALAGALSACGAQPADVANPLDCFPAEARRWVRVERPEAPQPAPPGGGNATIYVDRSGSMTGYLAGATASERPLHDLIGTLPAMLNRLGVASRYRAFGTQISAPLDQAQQAALMQPAFYACAGPYAAGCDNQESHLNRLFDEISRDRSGMAVVITDLWFSNSDVQTSALSALAEPLTNILASGRAVAVYGISAPFDGRIYDVPYAQGAVPFRGEHPLFAIVVGTDAQIARLHDAWKDAPSPYLRDGLGANRIKRTLFTLSPAAASAAPAAPLQGSDGAGVRQQPILEVREHLQVQQFEIDAAEAMRAPENAPAPYSWRGPTAAAFAPDSVWQGEFRTRTQVWERRGTSCTDADWLQGANIEGLWSGEGAQRQFSLKPEIVATELGRDGTYLVTAEIERTALLTPNPASAWMRAWGFTPADRAPLRQGAGGTPFFPTLHLGEVSRLLESALSAAAQREPRPIFGFAFAARVER
jgi:hypothetical protein